MRNSACRNGIWLGLINCGIVIALGQEPGGDSATHSQTVHKVGNGITAPSLISKPDPTYSEVARKLRVNGTVLLRLVVQSDGVGRDPKVVHSLGYGLDEKAIEAVRKWRFNPAMKDGQPVAVWANAQVNFRLLTAHTGEWVSGPMKFVVDESISVPVVKEGKMPKPSGNASNESVVLGFTVDARGSVTDLQTVSGSLSSSKLLADALRHWKFTPAMRGTDAVDAPGTVTFSRHAGDDRGN